MAKRTENIMVYDQRHGTKRGVKVTFTGPPDVLDFLSEGALTDEMLAQEAFEQPAKKFTIEVSVKAIRRG